MTPLDTRASQRPTATQLGRAGAGLNVPNGQPATDTHTFGAVGDPERLNGQAVVDTQGTHAVEPLLPQSTMAIATPKEHPSIEGQDSGGHQSPDVHEACAAAPTPRAQPTERAAPIDRASGLADPLLALAADVLDDLERVRIANGNRLRQLTRDETDKDGRERGFGLTVDHPDVARLAALVEALAKAEHDATLNLQRMVRKHPLGPWIRNAKGIGEKQGARLLAAIGDPYWHGLYDRPRTVSELWAFAGYHVLQLPSGQSHSDNHVDRAAGVPTSAVHELPDTHTRCDGGTQHPTDHQGRDAHGRAVGGVLDGSNPDHDQFVSQESYVGVAAIRARGRRDNWSATAKMRARLISESIIKCGGPYREGYDKGREKYTDATHAIECKRCGPTGKPAQPGSALSDGHKHARALRLVSKAVLRDLWREAKRLHEGGAS